MDNKNDWKEIEEWAEKDKQRKIDMYKFDINNNEEIEKNTRKVDKVVKFFNITLKTSTIFFIIIALILIFNILLILSVKYEYMKTRVNADIDSILDQYGTIEKKIISKEIDEDENGKYIFGLKNNKDIQFTAIKNWGRISNDFVGRYQKYIFDNWDSNVKNKFVVNESIDENGLLNYENYIIINKTNEIMEATEQLIEFLEYAEKWNKENKIIKVSQQKEGQFVVPIKVYLKTEKTRIYPYNAMFVTADEIREEAKKSMTNDNVE